MNRARNKLTREAGFTLVELLVVIMIVAVLAAIAIPAFFEQRDKARDAQTKQGLATARTAIELVRHEKRTYVGITAADLAAEEPTLVNFALNEPITTDNTYRLEAVSSSGTTFSVSRDSDGVLDFDCMPRDTGGCPLDGDWAE